MFCNAVLFPEANICPLFSLLCVWLCRAFPQSCLFHRAAIVVHKAWGMLCGHKGEVADLGILGAILWLDIMYTLIFKCKFLDLEILFSIHCCSCIPNLIYLYNFSNFLSYLLLLLFLCGEVRIRGQLWKISSLHPL